MEAKAELNSRSSGRQTVERKLERRNGGWVGMDGREHLGRPFRQRHLSGVRHEDRKLLQSLAPGHCRCGGAVVTTRLVSLAVEIETKPACAQARPGCDGSYGLARPEPHERKVVNLPTELAERAGLAWSEGRRGPARTGGGTRTARMRLRRRGSTIVCSFERSSKIDGVKSSRESASSESSMAGSVTRRTCLKCWPAARRR